MRLVIALIVLAHAPPARAQTPLSTENTKQACSDRVDNDGDGRVDCADQDCWDLVICANAQPGANAPPRKSGYTKLVLGAVLLSLGVVIGAASAGPWVVGGASYGDKEEALFGAAGAMDGVALAGIAAGAALLAIGVGETAASRHVTLAPRASSLSLSLDF